MESAETHILIDANIFLSFFDQTEELHTQAVYLFESFQETGQRVILLDHVIQEIFTVFFYKKESTDALKFLSLIKSEPYISIIDTSIPHLESAVALATHEEFQPRLSCIDWLLLFCAKLWNVELLTFDRQLKNTWKKLA